MRVEINNYGDFCIRLAEKTPKNTRKTYFYFETANYEMA